MLLFPKLSQGQKLDITTNLDGQIYSLDSIKKDDTAALLAWAKSVPLEVPKKPGKGEAERTSFRGALSSTEIADNLLGLIKPCLKDIDSSLKDPKCSPNIRIYHYPEGAFFGPHYDSPQLDPASKKLSCWTVLIYLTSAKGGGTKFYLDEVNDRKKDKNTGSGGQRKGKPGKGGMSAAANPKTNQELVVDPAPGRILLHWHGVARGGCLRHEGMPVEQGDKWIIRTDVLA